MLLAKKTKKIEDYIVRALHKRPCSGPELVKSLLLVHPKTSKETIYRELRRLLQDEVVHKHRQVFYLNRVWLQRLQQFTASSLVDFGQGYAGSVLSLGVGESLSVSFKSPDHMTFALAEIGDVLIQNYDGQDPFLIYHPHEWMIHTRTHSEQYFADVIKSGPIDFLFAIGGTDPLDVDFRKTWATKRERISTGIDLGLANTDYINVVGDYVITVKTNKSFADQVDMFYKNNKTITSDARRQLVDITKKSARTKLKIVRNADLAAKWKKKFGHFFIIKYADKNNKTFI